MALPLIKTIFSEGQLRAYFEKDVSRTSFAIKRLSEDSKELGCFQRFVKWIESFFWASTKVILDGKETTILFNKSSLSKRIGMKIEQVEDELSQSFSRDGANDKLHELGLPILSDTFDSLSPEDQSTILASLNALSLPEQAPKSCYQLRPPIQNPKALPCKFMRKVSIDPENKKIFIHLNKASRGDAILGRGAFNRVTKIWALFEHEKKLSIEEGAAPTMTIFCLRNFVEMEKRILTIIQKLSGAEGIVKIYGHLEYDGKTIFRWKKLTIFMSRYRSDLWTRLYGREAMTDAGRGKIARQLLNGLAILHTHGIIHRDLKPGNILLDDGENAFITDFNISTLDRKPTILGTQGYRAPETLRWCGRVDSDPNQDMFSMGVLLNELYHYNPPAKVQNLISRMLSRNPEKRPTAQEALEEFTSLYPDATHRPQEAG